MKFLCWLGIHKLVFYSGLKGLPDYYCSRCGEMFNEQTRRRNRA